jgi:hypothetical protein
MASFEWMQYASRLVRQSVSKPKGGILRVRLGAFQ